MARMVITIDPDGTSHLKVEGVQGPSCLKLSRDLQQALGRTTSDVKTGDFLAPPVTVKERAKVKA